MSKTRRVLATLGTTLVAMLAFGGLATAQAAVPHANGETFAELGVGTETFVSEGTFEMEIPEAELTLICDEKGSGLLDQKGVAEHNVALTNCAFHEPGGNECEVEDIKLRLPHPIATVYAESCFFFNNETELEFPSSLADQFGPEAVSLSASISDAPMEYGEWQLYVSNASTWELTGEYLNEEFGIW